MLRIGSAAAGSTWVIMTTTNSSCGSIQKIVEAAPRDRFHQSALYGLSRLYEGELVDLAAEIELKILSKLGVRNRTEAAAYASRGEPATGGRARA